MASLLKTLLYSGLTFTASAVMIPNGSAYAQKNSKDKIKKIDLATDTIDLSRLKESKYNKGVMAHYAQKKDDKEFLSKTFGAEDFMRLMKAGPKKIETKIQGFNGTKADGKHLPLQQVTAVIYEGQTKNKSFVASASMVKTDYDGNGIFDEKDPVSEVYLAHEQTSATPTSDYQDVFTLAVLQKYEIAFAVKDKAFQGGVRTNQKTGALDLKQFPVPNTFNNGPADTVDIKNGNYKGMEKLNDMKQEAKDKFYKIMANKTDSKLADDWYATSNSLAIPMYGAPVAEPAKKQEIDSKKPADKPKKPGGLSHN